MMVWNEAWIFALSKYACLTAFITASICQHVLDEAQRWIELEDVHVVDLDSFTKLVIVRESIVAFFASARKLHLAHWEVVRVCVLVARALFG